MATTKKGTKSGTTKKPKADSDKITPAIERGMIRTEIYIFTALSVLFLALAIAKYA